MEHERVGRPPRGEWAALGVFLIAVIGWVLYPCWTGQERTVVLVRHGETVAGASADPRLSPDGHARAAALARALEEMPIETIYVSDRVRAWFTAAPAATERSRVPIELPATQTDALVEHIESGAGGGTVLVVGDRTSVPRVITALGGPEVGALPENEYHHLFILTRCRCRWGRRSLLSLGYGAEPAGGHRAEVTEEVTTNG